MRDQRFSLRMSTSQVACGRVGSTKLHPERKSYSETTSSTPSQTGIGHSSVLKLHLELVSLCEWRPRAPSPRSILISSVLSAIDIFGHHRAVCARAGVLGRRGCALESVVARICREAGGRVAQHLHARYGLVVVDGLPLNGGCQLAIDTTLRVRHVLTAARRRKERRYPELVGPAAERV